MLQILTYNELKVPENLKKQTERVLDALRNGDFRAADVKKMSGTNGYYRAKLDDKARLLFRIVRHEGVTYLLILETLLNHEYEKSRFLNGRGALVDQTKWHPVAPSDLEADEALEKVAYINPQQRHFHLLDKFLSFDDIQQAIFLAPAPLITIGSAGSGKTALTLEKIKRLSGNILYVTHSSFLVENARLLYYAQDYENEAQSVDFRSYNDLLQATEMPQGQEMDFRAFNIWVARHKQAFHIRDTHKVFEEFRGVLSGNAIDRLYLSLDDYLHLGVRDSVFLTEERPRIYQLFQKYLAFLQEGKFYDSNLATYSLLGKIVPRYDFVVVDEVQDFTNVQLALILKALTKPSQFLLCGDSNQIVHPNFFSWKSVKAMFYKSQLESDIIRVLTTNYRNSPEVTYIANQLLMLKNLRFGSIDRESTYLIHANNTNKGVVQFFQDKPDVIKEINRATGRSTQFAIVVMRNEDKEAAQKIFSTPLVFSVKEAKGLEYSNIILYNMVSLHEKEFREICAGIQPSDLQGELVYARAKDKTDKSLEIYKFYINSLYVAITRAIDNLYVVEHNRQLDIWATLGFTAFGAEIQLTSQASSLEDWQREAERLEKQGKSEQAEEIKKQVLREIPVPWEVITIEKYEALKELALQEPLLHMKAKEKVYEYTAWYSIDFTHLFLTSNHYKRKKGIFLGRAAFLFNALPKYNRDNPAFIQKTINLYGVNHRSEYNYTPLMMAAEVGAVKIAKYLIARGADRDLRDNYGRTAFMIMLLNAYMSPKYATEKFPSLYPILCPDTLKIGAGNQVGIADSRMADFFVINLAYATFRFSLIESAKKECPSINIDKYVYLANLLPDSVMPAYRKKKQYITSILAKNEIFRHATNNYRVFLRMGRGKYILSPSFSILYNGQLVEVFREFILKDELERELVRAHFSRIEEVFQTSAGNYIRALGKGDDDDDDDEVFSNT